MIRRKTSTACIAALCATLLAACDQATSTGQLTDLKKTYWKVVGIPNSVNATLNFGSDGKITGFAGCNRFFATYTSTGQSLEISGIGSTKKMCPPADMSVERELLKTLAIVNRWHGDADKIALTAPTDKTAVRLKRKKNEK